MKITYFLLLSFFAFSCSNDNLKSQLEKDQLINTHFSKNDIKGLFKIINYTDSVVLSSTNKKDIDFAYHYYLDSLHNEMINNGVGYSPALDQDLKYDFVFKLNRDLLTEIWLTDSISRSIRTKDTILENLNDFPHFYLNWQGSYVDYVNSLGHKDEFYNEVYNSIQMAGDIPPTLRHGFFGYHQKLDFKKIENRLWIAIFILSLEETLERKVERYLDK